MDFNAKQIAPPKSWEVFEDLCLALFQVLWKDQGTQKNGRQGQPQAGVDVFGKNNAQGGGLWGVQCKCKDQIAGRELGMAEVKAELAKTADFLPKLTHLIIATTATSDVKIQKQVRLLNEERFNAGLCPVTIYAWDKIIQLLHENEPIAKLYYPEHFASLLQTAKPLRLPAITLSDCFADPVNHLAELRRQLQSGGSSALLAAATVQGMGGVGKTQLALKYSMEYQDDYAGVWWFQAETESMLEQDCILFCHKQGVALAAGEAAGAAMRAWLNGQEAQEARWLLVFDNAEDQKLLQGCLPQAAKHHIIITSRLRLWQGLQNLELNVWNEEQALAFLRPRLAALLPVAGDAQLRRLAAALDGLPLALEQACAYLINTGVSTDAYIAAVQAHEKQARLLGREDSMLCARSVLATLSLAFAKLSSPARALLELCGWLAAEPVPEYLFTEHADELPLLLQARAADELLWRETVAELQNYALCHAVIRPLADHMCNGREQVFCLTFHRLTQAAVRAGAADAQGGSAALALLGVAFPFYSEEPQHWPRCRALEPHALRLHELYQESWGGQHSHAVLLGQLATYLKYGPAQQRQAQQMEQQALLICQNALGEEHPDTLTVMNNLAETLRQAGDLPGARALEEKTLEIRRRVLGEEHPDTLTSMNNLAGTLWQAGDLPGARDLQEKTLEIRRRVLGEEHPDTLSSMNNLAETLRQAGDLPGARALHEKTLKIRRRVLGEEHPDTLTSMNNLALALLQAGDLPGAQALEEKALEIRRRMLGEEHPDTLIAMNNLARTLEDMGKLAAAIAMMEKTVTLRCKILGEQHPHTLGSKQSLANMRAAQNQSPAS